jgi:hypothetical protein
MIVIPAVALSMYRSPACRDDNPALAGLSSSGRKEPLINLVVLKRTTLRTFKIKDGCQSGKPLRGIIPGFSNFQAGLEQVALYGLFQPVVAV